MFSESPRVFISYAREDEAHALTLCDRLREHGISPWLDKDELLAGEEWADVIRTAIRQSDFVVICLSPRSVNKRGYIQREIRMALDCYQEIPPGQAYLVPALIEPCVVPGALTKFQWVELFTDSGYAHLIRSIRLHIEKRKRESASFVADRAKEVDESTASSEVSAPILGSGSSYQNLVEPLTMREQDVLARLAQRMTNKEIAQVLFVSTETVKTHLKNINLKLGVNNRRDAVSEARRLGLLDRL